MSDFYPGLSASPIHVRTAERNIYNAWVARGRFSLPRHFGNSEREAVAPHFSAVLADLSSFRRLRVHGPGAERLLGASCKCDLTTLKPGESSEVFWVNDGGGVRGNGIVARFGEENFVLQSTDTDSAWFGDVAHRFDAKVRSEDLEKTSLFLAGPRAAAILQSAQLGAALSLGADNHQIYDYNGISVTISRRSKLGGFELSCSADNGVILFDRLMEAGRPHQISLIGQEALEILCLEAGILLAGLDYTPARDIGSRFPSASSLGFAPAKGDAAALVGLEWDGLKEASFSALYRDGRKVGETLRSVYSPALQRVIALASVQADYAKRGTSLSVRAPVQDPNQVVSATIVELPFLAPSWETATAEHSS
jgi:aminomethyltransferase